MVILMVACAVLAQPIILIVFGNKYLEAIPVFQLMTLVMIPFLLSLVTTPAILYTYNKPEFFAKTTAVQVVSIIILEIILIPKFTYYAPVYALGVTNIIIFIITVWKLKKLINEDTR
jgi:O-antigen/teichoic acid export membrane protein